MLGRPEEDEDILDRLIQFGLTISEAKGWLEKEPNYSRPVLCSYDDNYHEPSNRRKLQNPVFSFSRTLLVLGWKGGLQS